MSGEHFHRAIRRIIEDRIHGATELVDQLIHVLQHHSPSYPHRARAFEALRTIDPEMVVVHHFLDSVQPQGDDFFAQLAAYKECWANVESRIADHLQGLLPPDSTILTHSRSGTVSSVVKLLSRDRMYLNVIQTRSIPGGEGVGQYEELKLHGLNCVLIEDHQVRALEDPVTCVLGCDHFTQHGFVNKVGSREITQSLADRGERVFVIGDTRKRVSGGLAPKDGSAQFEYTPFFESVTMITESGPMKMPD